MALAFWWVNHKQTYRQETDGGYIWSPKANANGARNGSYDNLTRCHAGMGCSATRMGASARSA